MNENVQDVQQTVKKLQFLWDKLVEFVNENQEELKEMAEVQLKDLQNQFQAVYKDVEEGVKKTENYLANATPKELEEKANEIRNKFDNAVNEFSNNLQKQVNNVATQVGKETQKEVAHLNLLAAQAHFKAGMQSIGNAFDAYKQNLSPNKDNSIKG